MIVFISLVGVGASGALYGLLLFFIMDRIIALRTNSDRRLFILLQLVLLVLLPLFITNLLMFMLKFKVAHSAHFGGGLVGFLCSVYILDCSWPWSSEHCFSQTVCRALGFIFLFLYFAITLTIFMLIDAPTVGGILYNF